MEKTREKQVILQENEKNNGGKQKVWRKPAGASAVISVSDDQRFV